MKKLPVRKCSSKLWNPSGAGNEVLFAIPATNPFVYIKGFGMPVSTQSTFTYKNELAAYLWNQKYAERIWGHLSRLPRFWCRGSLALLESQAVLARREGSASRLCDLLLSMECRELLVLSKPDVCTRVGPGEIGMLLGCSSEKAGKSICTCTSATSTFVCGHLELLTLYPTLIAATTTMEYRRSLGPI